MEGETIPPPSASGPDPKIRLIASDTEVGYFRMQGNHSNLETFLQQQALDHHNKHVSKTYVLEDEKRIVLAYISLCCGHVELEHPIDDLVDYKYPVPAVRIGKLAVSRQSILGGIYRAAKNKDRFFAARGIFGLLEWGSNEELD